jgi:hypothetical protein
MEEGKEKIPKGVKRTQILDETVHKLELAASAAARSSGDIRG